MAQPPGRRRYVDARISACVLQRVGDEVEAVAAAPADAAAQNATLLLVAHFPHRDAARWTGSKAVQPARFHPAIRVMFITGFAAVALQGGPGRRLELKKCCPSHSTSRIW